MERRIVKRRNFGRIKNNRLEKERNLTGTIKKGRTAYETKDPKNRRQM